MVLLVLSLLSLFVPSAYAYFICISKLYESFKPALKIYILSEAFILLRPHGTCYHPDSVSFATFNLVVSHLFLK